MAGVVPFERVAIDLAGPPLRVHLVGIGGAGMSAIAEVFTACGHHVSGSDRGDSPMLARLRSHGIDARVGHDAANVVGADVVGVSTAIRADNPEVVAALEAGIPVAHRYDLLAAIGATRRTLSVSGTHGKTTTSALLALALDAAGLDPSFIIGGNVAGFGSGSRWTDGEWLVLEADESDSTFLAPPRAGAIITNIEPDHLDHHGSFEALLDAFQRFGEETDGPVLVCADDVGAAPLLDTVATSYSYGTSALASFMIGDIETGADGTRWTVTDLDGVVHPLSIGLPGHHLVLNATAAFALATMIGADPVGAAAGIARYAGVGRRFEARGEAGGVSFVDDYAHMPTEVRAVLQAARTAVGAGRIVAVFQPHRYSRTSSVWREYAEAFDGADVVVLTEIYAAGEEPVPGVSGELIADAVRRARPHADVRWMPDRESLLVGLPALLEAGDLCLTMGAGDLTTLPDALVAALGGDGA
ncbi:MAG: UDP-N-acetylmuramate--L-alanine ligase [Acidimicrobiales bacterium]